jgi:predicted ester cyclase
MKKSLFALPMAVSVFVMIGCGEKEPNAAFEAMKTQAEMEDQNKEIVKRWIGELDKGNLGIVDELIAEDSKIYYGEEAFGREWLRASCATFYQSFSDSLHVVEDLIAEKDKVVARLTVRVTDSRGFRGAPPTGKTVEYHGYTLYRVEAAKIQELWMDQNATMELMLKLGLELKPRE